MLAVAVLLTSGLLSPGLRTLHTNSPDSIIRMADSNVPLADFLARKKIDASIVATPASAPTGTVEESAASLGLSDASRLVKSLVFVANSGVPLLVLAPGTVRVDKKALLKLMRDCKRVMDKEPNLL